LCCFDIVPERQCRRLDDSPRFDTERAERGAECAGIIVLRSLPWRGQEAASLSILRQHAARIGPDRGVARAVSFVAVPWHGQGGGASAISPQSRRSGKLGRESGFRGPVPAILLQHRPSTRARLQPVCKSRRGACPPGGRMAVHFCCRSRRGSIAAVLAPRRSQEISSCVSAKLCAPLCELCVESRRPNQRRPIR
jgi:hypothetical protein